MTHPYGVRDVERLVGLPRATIRSFIAAGFVSPARGARNSLRFSFQDLIVLRTAQALADADVPARRITGSLKELRRHLPESMPMSGLSIGAVADRVVVKEGGSRWQAESGQYLLAFEGDPAAGSLSVVERKPEAPDWFAAAVAIEDKDAEGAMRAYRQAVAADPHHVEARINMGLLLHEAGRLKEAEQVYREAIKVCGARGVLLFNLAVLLEDMGRKLDAMRAYELVVRVDPGLADAHYNLALLCENAGQPKDAIRHMAQYRRLLEQAR